MKKKYTLLQMERRLRAKDKGAKRSLAADLHKVATMLEKRKTGALTKEELECLSDIPPLVGLVIACDGMTKEAITGERKN